MNAEQMWVTGANGFVGRALCTQAQRSGFAVTAVTRSAQAFPAGVRRCLLAPDGTLALHGVAVLVHLGARVHAMADRGDEALAQYRRVNVDWTLELARQAAAQGVRRFIFLSSIKVHGECTAAGRPFTATDVPAPQDAYAVSKWEAELGLHTIAAQTGMELVIIRPPLVYGPGVKANFARLLRALQRGLPLPLGAIDNRRSLLALDNLVHLIVTCATHPAAGNQTFLACDGEDVSSADLLRRLARCMGRPARLVPVPVACLAWAGRMVGQQAAVQRLCASLQIDMRATRETLQWNPPCTLDAGLEKVVRAYVAETSV